MTHTGEVNGHGVSAMPDDFAGPYQEAYGAGYARGHEAGYRTVGWINDWDRFP